MWRTHSCVPRRDSARRPRSRFANHESREPVSAKLTARLRASTRARHYLSG
jgi:hypothetical protein